MISPNQSSSYKYSLFVDHSISGLQTDYSTSRISLSDLKNISKLKKSMNIYCLKRKYYNNMSGLSCNKLTNSKIYNIKYMPFISSQKNLTKKEDLLTIINNKKIRLMKNDNKSGTISRNKNNELLKYNFYSNDHIKEKKSDPLSHYYNFKLNMPYYSYYPSRKNSINYFKIETSNLRYLKVNSYNGKKAVDKLKENIAYNNTKTESAEFSNKKNNILLDSYNNNLNQYYFHLEKQRNDLSIKDLNLRNKQIMIYKDIVNLKIKINKILVTFETYLDAKFFLLCVKEGTFDFKKFSKKNQIDIINDLYKWILNKNKVNYEFRHDIIIDDNNVHLSMNNFYNYLVRIIENIKSDFDANKKTMFLNYILISLDRKSFFEIYNNIKDHIKISDPVKVNNIFNNLEELDNKIINFSYKNQLLLKSYNKLSQQLLILRKEKQKEKERIEKESKYVNSKKEKEANLEEKFEIIKSIYENSLNEYDNKKDYQEKEIYINLDKKLNLIMDNILKYKSEKIKSIFNDENRNDYKKLTLIEKIALVQKVILYLLNYINEKKLKSPNDYNKAIKYINKKEIAKRLLNREEEKQKLYDLKIKKIFEKNSKILFLPHKKIGLKNK